MLRKTRITLACVFFIGITLLFIGTGREWWGWMAKLQFLPSCLALNAAVIIGVLLLTFVLGRIYCSVICPMGVFQDLIIWLRRRAGLCLNKIGVKKAQKYAQARKEGKEAGDKPVLKPYVKHFEYHKEHKIARYAVLAVFILALVIGLQFLVALVAPYSAYGRIVRSIAGLAEGSSMALPLLLVAGITLVVIFICAWFWGREWCNTICPVGTVLSLVGRFSLFRISIDADKCKACGRCGRGCKASCIDMDNHKVDYSRCVDCFDCIDRCKEGAVKFKFAYCNKKAAPAEEKTDEGRRNFIITAATLAGAATIGSSVIAEAQEKHLDGGLADVISKQAPERSERLVPFGSRSVKDFYDRCTACQLCVSNCPNDVLRPSTDLEHFLQPQMGYEKGYCRPECNICSQVCPAGAILPVEKGAKLTMHIGLAKVNTDLCLAFNGEETCGNCSRHCPVGAIRMVSTDGSKFKVPTVSEDLCIGCGACENLCPVRPISAITVNGLSEHRNG